MSALSSLSGLPPALATRAASVAPAIAAAARKTGVDFATLLETARLESGFNPTARARTSSATGLFQFLDSSWLATLARHGAKHGIDVRDRAQALALRMNPEVASLMAAEHMADNARALEAALGTAASSVDLYLAHFLGASGAARFLKQLRETPDAVAAQLFPRAAAANRSIFYASEGPRSMAEVHALFARRLGIDVPAAAQGSGNSVPGLAQALARRPGARPADRAPEGVPETRESGAAEASAAARAARLILAQLGA
ncbi:transglycosylase SLT domain-containing protein [Thermaurantiacus sp.]